MLIILPKCLHIHITNIEKLLNSKFNCSVKFVGDIVEKLNGHIDNFFY